MSKASSPAPRVVAACVALACVAPVVYAAVRYGESAIFNLFAADSYYYFTIAKNTSLGARASFDATAATNGFHPLWQYLLLGVWRLVGGEKNAFLWAVFVLNTTLAGIAWYVLAKAVVASRRAPVLALFLVPGIFHVFVPEQGLYSLSAWRVLNGMETSLSLLFLSLLVERLAAIENRGDDEPWKPADDRWIGSLAALAVLSRLDNLALVAVLPLYLAGSRSRPKSAAWLAAPPLLVFVAYVAFNLAAGLPAVPVSGSTKTTFCLVPNVRVILDTLLAPFGQGLGVSAPEGWRLRSRMLAALIGGCLVSLSIAAVSHTRTFSRSVRDRPSHTVFVPIVLLLLARLFYYVSFVKLSHQGFWYYGDVAALLSGILLLQIGTRTWMPRAAWQLVPACVWLIVYVHFTQRFLDFTATNRWCPHLLAADAEKLTRCLSARFPQPKLLDSSDGVFAFFLDFPAEPGTGLTATAAGHRIIVESGRAAYHEALVRDGYVVNTVSSLCYSGEPAPKLVKERIRCGQDPALRIYRLASGD